MAEGFAAFANGHVASEALFKFLSVLVDPLYVLLKLCRQHKAVTSQMARCTRTQSLLTDTQCAKRSW